MSWDDDLSSRRLAALDVLKARFGLKTPEEQANDNIAAALAILTRAQRERLAQLDDPVILVLPAGWFDTDSDPYVIPWPLPADAAEDDQLPF